MGVPFAFVGGAVMWPVGDKSQSAIVGAAADCYLPAMKALALKEEQFVTDAKGKRLGVLLDVKTYERLRDAEEDLADIRAYDAARPKIQAEVTAGNVVSLAEYRAKRSTRRK